MKTRRVLLVVMDGVGVREERFGNAVLLAKRPHLLALEKDALYRTLYAHGTYVGMPSDADLGNSEVGHNAIGAGRIFDQGAKLVGRAISDGSVYRGATWKSILAKIGGRRDSALHLIGLLSDGNVHSHEDHLFSLIRKAKEDGVKKVYVHALLDGRDVGEKTAEIYAARLAAVFNSVNDQNFTACVASGGGRMVVTMDRYEADWSIVERGWLAHVHGIAPHQFASLENALSAFRSEGLTDQYLPPFVIVDSKGPVGRIASGDAVIFFNFRGDRAVEISRAFDEKDFAPFNRHKVPDVYYAGMMEYDGDQHIPKNYLVQPPTIDQTLGEYLAHQGQRQFACSETQKFGHVTFFWNGNRSNMFAPNSEQYVEIPSDRIEFDKRPQMKAQEITDVTITELKKGSFDFGRINFANGDMVGHTGNLSAAITAVEVVDTMIGRLQSACEQTGTILVVTADHGNCDEMFDANPKDYPNWSLSSKETPRPKTSHTVNPVPFYIFNPLTKVKFALVPNLAKAGLANIANTVLVLMGLPPRDLYYPSLVYEKES